MTESSLGHTATSKMSPCGPPTQHVVGDAGSVSGAVVSACVQPLDVLRTRMQADAAAGSLQGVRRTMRTLFREGGLKCALLLMTLPPAGPLQCAYIATDSR